MKAALVAVGLALLATPARATEQTPDTLLYEGRQYPLAVEPLDGYLAAHPEQNERIQKGAERTISTDNWRGYLATWTVAEGRLQLVDVTVPSDRSGRRSILKDLFPAGTPDVANWFDGYLVLPDGKPLGDPLVGAEYDHYLIIRVEDGIVTDTAMADLEDFHTFRAAQFDAFKETNAFREAVSAFADGLDDEQRRSADETLRVWMAELYLWRLF